MANVDLSNCPHSGFFRAVDSRCSQCLKSYECEWLNSTDEFNGLANKPMEFLYRALAFGIDYVDARNALAESHDDSCACDSCEWLTNARLLGREHIQ